jgi:hypothetical protein
MNIDLPMNGSRPRQDDDAMNPDAGIIIKLIINNEKLIMKNALEEIVHAQAPS